MQNTVREVWGSHWADSWGVGVVREREGFFFFGGGCIGVWRKGGWGARAHERADALFEPITSFSLSPTLQFNLPSRCLDSNSSGLAGSAHTHINYSSHAKERIWKTRRGRLFDGEGGREGLSEGERERDRKGGRMTFGPVPFFLFIFPSPFSDIHLLLCSTGARRLLEKNREPFIKRL